MPLVLKIDSENLSGEAEFGELIGGMKYKVELHFANFFSEPIEVVRIKTSCGCIGGFVPEKEYNPGEVVPVRVLFDAPTQSGKFSKVLSVFLGGIDRPLELQIRGSATPVLRLGPAELIISKERILITKNLKAKVNIPKLQFANDKVKIDNIALESGVTVSDDRQELEIQFETLDKLSHRIVSLEGSTVSVQINLEIDGKKVVYEQYLPVNRYWGFRTSPKTIWLDELSGDHFKLKLVIVGLRDENLVIPDANVPVSLPEIGDHMAAEFNVASRASGESVRSRDHRDRTSHR